MAMQFIALIVANIMTILTNRSWSESIFTILRTQNPTVKWVTGGAFLFIILIMTIPFLLRLFQFSPISVWKAIIVSVAGVSTITWFELYKYFKLSNHV